MLVHSSANKSVLYTHYTASKDGELCKEKPNLGSGKYILAEDLTDPVTVEPGKSCRLPSKGLLSNW